MEKVKSQIKSLVLLYDGLSNKLKFKKGKSIVVSYLKDSLEIIDSIDYSKITDQSYIEKLDILLESIITENWEDKTDPNRFLKVKIDELINELRKRHKQIQELRKKELKGNYQDIDEWVSEKNFLQVLDPKSKRQILELNITNYTTEYSLFLDMRDTLLTRGISGYNAKYFYQVATQIEEELTLDIEKGRITVSEGTTELLKIAKLTRSNKQFKPSIKMKEIINDKVKEKKLLQTIDKYYF
ncbi:MAG: hypothetical protein E7168_03125 [Firmicutes bacterium]|nr:hypothetical protein [Bacillota bacterium]